MEKTSKTYILIRLILLFLAFFLLHFAFRIGESQYYYDVVTYHSIGKSMFADGHFSLRTLNNDTRGFVFPFIMGISSYFNEKIGFASSFRIISSAFLALFVSIFNEFCKSCFVRKEQDLRRIILGDVVFTVLLCFFFYGIIIYPLTDIYAALLCSGSAFVIYRILKSDCAKKSIGFAFGAGILAYLSYNTRTIYSLYIITVLIVLAAFAIKRHELLKGIGTIIGYVLGILISAIPQFMINWWNYHIVSPWINTENIFAEQLFWGLQYSRYATYVGNPEIHSPGLYFYDRTGQCILSECGQRELPITIQSYVTLFLEHPLEYVSVFGRHLYNACFILFPESYITDLGKNLIPLALLSLAVVFLFLVLLVAKCRNRQIDGTMAAVTFAMIVPTLAILFGAVEERFLILPYILIYGFIAYYDYSSLKRYITKKNIVILLCIMCLFFISALSVENNILINLGEHPLYFRGIFIE